MSASKIDLIRSIRTFWITSFQVEFEYQFNALIESLAVVGNLLGSLFVLSLFYSDGSTLGGWSWNESLIVLGFYTLLDAIMASFLQPNLTRIVRHVQNGTLDFVLLKPIDSQLWLSLRIISPWGFPSFVLGLLLIFYGLYLGNIYLNLVNLAIATLMFISSALILYSIWFLVATTSIWFVKIWNATEVLRSILVAGRYPVDAYPITLRFVFTFLFPIAFLTSVPAQAILGTSSFLWFILALLISASFFMLSRRFWLYALTYYTSASS